MIDPGGVDDSVTAACEGLLSPSERVQYARFICKDAQKLFLVARALVRTTLSRYWPTSPFEWKFSNGLYGRPYIDSPDVPWLNFNLSHTSGLVVCAIGINTILGVDVERIDRKIDWLSIAPAVFTAPELLQLCTAPSLDRQREIFFRLWTLKEAYIKATGQGFSACLDHFWFDVLHTRAQIFFDPKIDDDPQKWFFWEKRLSTGHRLAVAARQSCADAIDVAIRHVAQLAT